MTTGQLRRSRRDSRILALGRAGLSERQIAALSGLSPSRVHAILGALHPEKSERRKIVRSPVPSLN